MDRTRSHLPYSTSTPRVPAKPPNAEKCAPHFQEKQVKAESHDDPATVAADVDLEPPPQQSKRGRGRPRKKQSVVQPVKEEEALLDPARLAADVDVMMAAAAAAPLPKRKRGRPHKLQSVDRAVKKKKKEEEDVCFICFDGGNLIGCDRRDCPKVYHAECVSRDEDFFKSDGKWDCGWHICSVCEKAVLYMCYTCTYSLCKRCCQDAGFAFVRGNKGFCGSCYNTVMLIEANEQSTEEKVEIHSNDKSSFDCLFRSYWLYLKEKFSLTVEELHNAKRQLKGSASFAFNQDSSSDELYNSNDENEVSSDSSSGHRREGCISLRKKVRDHYRATVNDERTSTPERIEWASKELLEFVAHMKGGDRSALSQFDVQALLLEYIKENNLRDPHKKSQIICDLRLKTLFGKTRVGHFEMLKLLESQFLMKDILHTVTNDDHEADVDPDSVHLDTETYIDGATKGTSDKRRKGPKKHEERESQTNLVDYAAIDVHNISQVYLRRSVIEELLDDADNFNERVIGYFVRIRIPDESMQQLYRLVQVVGTKKVTNSYKIERKTTDFQLEILSLDKMQYLSVDSVSNQDFTEEECERLRQCMKHNIISPLTVKDIQEKARALQAVRVNDCYEKEKQRLCHLRDRASETGRRKELRECVEKLQLLSTKEELIRRTKEEPEIHTDLKMDPDYKSSGEESDDKVQDVYSRSRESSPLGKRRDLLSHNVRLQKGSNFPPDSSRSTRMEASHNSVTERTNEPSQTKVEDILQTNTWGIGTRTPNATGFEAGVYNNNQPANDTGLSNGLPPKTSSSPLISKTSDTEKIWNYKDPSGTIQGPFSMVQLRKWSTTGYFLDDMRIWRASENKEESILLDDALIGKFEKNLQQSEPPQSNFSQLKRNTDGRENRADQLGGSQRENNSITSTNNSQNNSKWTGTDSIKHPDGSSWASQSYSGWYGQQYFQSAPRPNAHFYGNPYKPPFYPHNGVQGVGNVGVWYPGPNNSSWSPNPRAGNWGSQWGNDSSYFPSPAQLPSSQVLINAQGPMHVAPFLTPGLQPMSNSWGTSHISSSPTPFVHLSATITSPPIGGTTGCGSYSASIPKIANNIGGANGAYVSDSQHQKSSNILVNHSAEAVNEPLGRHSVQLTELDTGEKQHEVNKILSSDPEVDEILGSDPALISSAMGRTDHPLNTEVEQCDQKVSLIGATVVKPFNGSGAMEPPSNQRAEGPPLSKHEWERNPNPNLNLKPVFEKPNPVKAANSANEQLAPQNSNIGNGSPNGNLHKGWETAANESENDVVWGGPVPENPNSNPNQGWGTWQVKTNTTAKWGSEDGKLSVGKAIEDGSKLYHTRGNQSGGWNRGRQGSDSRRYSRYGGKPRYRSRSRCNSRYRSRHDSRYEGSSRYDSRRGGGRKQENDRRYGDCGRRLSRTPPRDRRERAGSSQTPPRDRRERSRSSRTPPRHRRGRSSSSWTPSRDRQDRRSSSPQTPPVERWESWPRSSQTPPRKRCERRPCSSRTPLRNGWERRSSSSQSPPIDRWKMTSSSSPIPPEDRRESRDLPSP